MLTIPGNSSRYCDSIERRSFLRIGGLAMGGLGLSQLLRAEESAGGKGGKSVIMIVLPGGPPHLDMYDMKPDAPAEIRGEFKPIASRVPGIDICELLPGIASVMDKVAIIRSLYGGLNDHNVHQCLTGWETHPQQGDSPFRPGFPAGGWPSMGAVISRLQGPVERAVPSFVSLSPPNAESTTRASLNQAGFLGVGDAGFEPNRKKRADIVYQSGVSTAQVEADAEQPAEIALQGISLDRLGDRRALLGAFDQFRRDVDASGIMDGMDAINRQAFGILTSGALAEALNWKAEDESSWRRYGIKDTPTPELGGPELLKQFLIARRLVQAGTRCVTLTLSQWPLERMSRGGFNWDWHKENFANCRATLPLLDIGLTALIKDLAAHDMLDDVSIVVWGEFGRTPKINATAGRDHWPQANSVLLAGGGMRTGQVIGSTNRLGEEPATRPVHYRDVFATLYHQMGFTADDLVMTDLRGRPQMLLGDHQPIDELV